MAELTPPIASAASVPAVNPAGKPSVVESLELGPKVTLILEHDALVVHDKSSAKSSRTSCPPIHSSSSSSKSRPIALYNILWAELSPDSQTLTISHAQETKKTQLRAAKLKFPVPPIANVDTVRTFITTLVSRSYGSAKQRKRAYVLINPNSGPGEADKLFEREARGIFQAARMELTVVTTKHSGHAVELAEKMDVDKYDVVIACSGDGLPHEIFNGLGQRPDAGRALRRMPVVMLPCGSGNAMACNLYGTHRPSLAALAIVKGVDTPFDLVSVTQGDKRTLSFLSQSLGLVADLDITTESMRWMGSTRFTVGFFWLVWKKNLYPCDLAVKVEIDHKDGVREHYKTKVEGSSAGESSAESVQKSDVESEATRTAASEEDTVGLPPLKYGTVQDKLPEGWELMRHEKLWSFYCGNMAYMSPGLDFFPAAMANDGLMDVVTIDGPVSAAKAVEVQLGVENGNYFDNPLIKYRKVSAYRLIPRVEDPNGIISIDGERFDFKPFQAEVHHALGRTLSKVGGYENPGPKHWDKVTVSERLLA
ncbi:ATP-NAD kinase-like domain-containing protein [Coniochaeta sp. 2T2.1]|nr:ATP-NAD kinase-like domain-containing protein [Coniochaeta sp. 2T2.1]